MGVYRSAAVIKESISLAKPGPLGHVTGTRPRPLYISTIQNFSNSCGTEGWE